MKQAFIEKTFSPSAQKTIDLINSILEDYRRQGFRLSLRQLYYQLVARAYIENTENSYKRIGNLVSDARQAGQIDWEMIEDRGRETVSVSHWKTPVDIVRSAANSFRIDKWADQDWHIEVMVEKDALSGVLGPVCARLDIPITANKGYSSSSTMYEIGRRLRRANLYEEKRICIIYLGDHDPSGIDMSRDVEERLGMYSELDPDKFKVLRIALNYDQVERWNPPENPAKTTDSRFASYAEQFGESSWELDAVEPATMAQLLEEIVVEHRDDERWYEAVEREENGRAELLELANNYGQA